VSVTTGRSASDARYQLAASHANAKAAGHGHGQDPGIEPPPSTPTSNAESLANHFLNTLARKLDDGAQAIRDL